MSLRRDERARPGTDEPKTIAAPHEAPVAARLGDARLRGPGTGMLRASVARQAQQLIGNHAVANLLARAAPATAPPVKHFSGGQIDAMFAKSPFFAPYVQPQVDGGRVIGDHVHLHPNDEFIALCVAYMKGKQNPDTREPFTDAEAAAYALSIDAFHDEPEIHVNQDRGDGGTALHEGVHHYVHATWRPKVGRNVDEGVTECLTARLCKENNVPHAIRGYELQHRSALKLIAATSWEQVADAYFKGSVIALENAVDDRDPVDGLGTFAGWLRLMDNGRFADADALL